MSEHIHPAATVARLDEDALGAFAEDLAGELVLPDADGYEDARGVWNGLVNRYPAIVARCAGAADVARAIDFAGAHDLPLSVKGGAHNQTGAAVVDNGLTIDCSPMDHVEVDPDERVARVGPGLRAEDALAVTQEHGLAFPTGSAGDVGIAGSTLGGGIGWIRRKHGLAIDALRRVEIVTADGEVRTASPEENADLHWAVRGGGGNFGVVTEFEFDCVEVGPLVQALGVYYPIEASRDAFETLRAVMADAPDELTAMAIHGEVPGLPPVPEALAGERAVSILGCWAGDPEDGEAAIEPLRTVAEPLLDLSDVMPYQVLHDLGTQMYPWGRKYTHRSVFLPALTDEFLDVIVEQGEAAPSPLSVVTAWALGGNVGHGPDSAFNWADQAYMVTIEANWEDYETPANLEWARETERQLREAGAVGRYAGFTGLEEQPGEDWAAEVYGDGLERLRAVKAAYDPENVFRLNVNVEPAED